MKKIMIILLLLAGCGFNGNQKLTLKDSKQRVELDGESYTYIVVRLDFIEQVHQLCLDLNPIEDFETESGQKKAVAQCTLDNMSLLNINLSQVTDFTNNYCDEDTDLSEFSEEQQQEILDACGYLGGI